MHKVLVQLGLLELPIIVLIDKLVDRDAVLLGVGLQDVGKVTGLGLWRNPLATRSVPRQPRLNIQRRFPHPIRMVLLDRRPNRTFKPLDMLLLHLARHLVVDLECEIRHERRLGSREVVGSVPVEDLVVVLDLKDEVLDVVHCHFSLAIDEQAETGKVRVPVVELKGISTSLSNPLATHLVERFDEFRIIRLGRQDLDGKSQLRLLPRPAQTRQLSYHQRHPRYSHLPIILRHLRLPMRHINQRLCLPTPILRIRTNQLQPIAVNLPRQRVPEGILDHSAEPVDGVLEESGFV
jgi:hypothetical protein